MLSAGRHIAESVVDFAARTVVFAVEGRLTTITSTMFLSNFTNQNECNIDIQFRKTLSQHFPCATSMKNSLLFPSDYTSLVLNLAQ